MNILITGASGFIGQNLIQSLLTSQHNVADSLPLKEFMRSNDEIQDKLK